MKFVCIILNLRYNTINARGGPRGGVAGEGLVQLRGLPVPALGIQDGPKLQGGPSPRSKGDRATTIPAWYSVWAGVCVPKLPLKKQA